MQYAEAVILVLVGALYPCCLWFLKREIEKSFKKQIERYKAELNRGLEELKLSLRNSEVVFSRQLEALTKLRRIFRHLLPKKERPDMDWHEACEGMAYSFSKHADDLDDFLGCYGAVLPTDVLNKIETAAVSATEGAFQLDWEVQANRPPEPSREAVTTAESIYDSVSDAVANLQKTINSQIAAPAKS